MTIEKPLSKFLQWLLFCLVLLILQCSLLPLFFKAYLIPYLIWIPFFYVLLYKSFHESSGFLVFITFLSSVFLPYGLTPLFFIYLSGFLFFLTLKKIFLLKSLKSFFLLVFLFSFYFSSLIQSHSLFIKISLSADPIPYGLSVLDLEVEKVLPLLSKSLMTSFFALLFGFKSIKRAGSYD